MSVFCGCRGFKRGRTWGPMVSLQRRCRSFDFRLGRVSSGLEICLLENSLEEVDHCGVFFFFGEF